MKIDRPGFPQESYTYRVTDNDGSHPGYYCVTLVNWRLNPIFGSVVSQISQLSSIGKIIWREWKNLERGTAGLQLDVFMVMPNHLHALVLLLEHPRMAASLGHVVNQYKATTTHLVHDFTHGTDPIWQRSYIDPVSSKEGSLDRVRRMILENPQRWG